ncbi:MAG: O-acetyl-ADP-ribose deacetylase [Deltaproteobacteria bacterium GWB2_55_19]|nr:MAG: O-acetyl-ADP-ribose deacetylase [Deltaproteobacteria bacterium GWB2_55_19]HAO93982.1 O-acetyl-ADP-ribose deacetylase [Deltaproteobacteria bacterium]
MEAKVNDSTISLIRGDITLEATDAIVNAANSRLIGGGGVDGAIHRAGGTEIMAECRKIGGCPTGGAVITTAGRLKARKVIHTVGPIYKDGRHQEAELLASSYSSCLNLALEHGLKSLSFPSISTGAYGYPVEEAAEAALRTIISFLSANKGIDLVRFVLFSDADLKTYAEALRKLTS